MRFWKVSESMICTNCGASIPDGQTVCPLCGLEQPEAAAGNRPEEAAYAPEAPAEPAAAEPQESGEERCEEAGEEPGAGQDAADGTGAESPEAEQPDAPAVEPAEPQPEESSGRKKPGGLLLAGLIVVGLAAVALLVFAVISIFNGSSDPAPDATQQAVDSESAGTSDGDAGDVPAVTSDYTRANEDLTEADGDLVVATCGDQELTNTALSLYYWQQYYSFMSNYGTYAVMQGLDTEKPLGEQMFDSAQTWEEFFLETALRSFAQNAALNAAAEAEGVTLSETQLAYLTYMEESMTSEAEANGYESVDAYLQSAYGHFVQMEDYLEFARITMLSSYYLESKLSEVPYDASDVNAYFEENRETYEAQGLSLDEPKLVNVRHILIMPEETAETDGAADAEEAADASEKDEASWAAAEQKAQELLEQWKAGDATEESFAQLATEYSQDPGSVSNGGLYEALIPGETVEAFDAWCFDASRQPGDTAVVETPYGYHIMYFSSYCDYTYGYLVAEQDYLYQLQTEILDEAQADMPMEADYSKVILTTSELM